MILIKIALSKKYYLIYKKKQYESAGLYGKSTLRLIDPSSGNVLKQVKIPDKYFAEGITIVGYFIFIPGYH